MPAFSLTTSAFFRYSSLMILLTELSLPGTAEAEMITRSPAWISTCLWVEKAMRKRADMASPWLPVVMIHTFVLGQGLDVVDVHHDPFGDVGVPQFGGHPHGVLHAPAGDGHFPAIAGGHVDDLLESGHVGGEGG